MKIAYLTVYYWPVEGGVERHVDYFAQEMIKKGHNVEVFTSDLGREGKIKKKYDSKSGVKISRFKTIFKLGFSGAFFPGVFSVAKKDFDIIHVHVYRHPFNFIPFFTNKKCVLTLHWPEYPKKLRKWYSNFGIWFIDLFFGKLILNKFDKLLAITGLEIDWIKNKFKINKNKIGLIPNGIPKSYLKIRNGNKFRNKWKVGKNEIMTLSLSRLHKSKGFDQVIKIAKDFPKVKFFIGGVDGGYENYLKKLSKNLKNVIFTGPLSDEEKLEAMNATDIFIHPSHYEGFGIVVLEAMSQGAAILTSDRGGLPWVVDKSGLTFECENLKDLKNKLSKLVEDKKLRNKLSKMSLQRAKKFTWEKIGNNLEKVYKECINNPI
ncbi:glycosyltransferase family 4 protein [bacterium]|nr:glycosyltransferase family 4 protein [bacterium]